jgi:hypothetical protein
MPAPIPVMQQIENFRATRHLSIDRDKSGNLAINNPPPVKAAGMYWFYTSYTIEELKACAISGNPGVIPINHMARLHEGLPHVSTIEIEGFRLVYNGIAGATLGLRGRIHQHFNGGVGTGCLSILRSSVNDLNRWRVSYVTLGPLGSTQHDVQVDYSDEAIDLERTWRLTHGWPLFCRT